MEENIRKNRKDICTWHDVLEIFNKLEPFKKDKIIYLLTKRVCDVAASTFALIIVSPSFVIVTLINKLSGNDVFFLQERVGKNLIPFKIFKYATMVKDAHIIGPTITVENDPRITKFGKILRKTKVNEIPQFINILLGQMSFVGPRPISVREIDLYPEKVLKEIYTQIPGATGWGTLYFHDEESIIKSNLSKARDVYAEEILPKKSILELWYKKNKSFVLDLQIIFMTAYIILASRLIGKRVKRQVYNWMKKKMGKEFEFIFTDSEERN